MNAMRTLLSIGAAACLTLAACSEAPPESRYVDENESAGAPAPVVTESAPPADEAAPNGAVVVAGISLTPDPSWAALPARPPMRQAQFSIGSGEESAEVVVFHFGAGQGGSVDDNLVRWARLVRDENDEPTMPTISEFESGALRITLAEYAGTYLSGMPGGEQTPREGWVLLAAIIENGPNGTIFPRLVGPAATVTAQREAFIAFLQSAAVVE